MAVVSATRRVKVLPFSSSISSGLGSSTSGMSGHPGYEEGSVSLQVTCLYSPTRHPKRQGATRRRATSLLMRRRRRPVGGVPPNLATTKPARKKGEKTRSGLGHFDHFVSCLQP